MRIFCAFHYAMKNAHFHFSNLRRLTVYNPNAILGGIWATALGMQFWNKFLIVSVTHNVCHQSSVKSDRNNPNKMTD